MTVPENELSRGKKALICLTILQQYSDDIAADHDIIYAGPDDTSKVSEEDQIRLIDLGWHIDSSCNSWARFV